MIEVITAGRTDINKYFRDSGVFDNERNPHTPFLVFEIEDERVIVNIVEKPKELLSYPDDTPVMGQWPGQWRSDYFQFKVGQYRRYVNDKLDIFKTATNVVKRVGPRGGFRSLSYTYVNKRGASTHASTSSKSEAQTLEAFFVEQGIEVRVEQQ